MSVKTIVWGPDVEWVLITEDNPKITSQSVVRAEGDFPFDRVEKWWGQGRRISQVSYGDNTWVVIANGTEGEKNVTQNISTKIDFPKEKIVASWESDKNIVVLENFDGLWVLVTESGAKAISQTYVVAGEFPDQKIKSYWNEGYRVRSVCCGQGSWAIIFEKPVKAVAQNMFLNTKFPFQDIKDAFKENKGIVSLCYSEEHNLWVGICEESKYSQSLSTGAHFPDSKIKELGIYRYGYRD